MTAIPGQPPGRAGRLWLQDRLALAEGAADLLDLKTRLLDERIAAATADRATAEVAWSGACAAARRWAVRARVLTGESAMRAAVPTTAAQVSADTATLMGVRFPAAVRCELPVDEAAGHPTPPLVVSAARRAHREALCAAAELAAADRRARDLKDERDRTGQRSRALRHRWIPTMQNALRELAFTLEETERADIVRARWVREANAGCGDS